MHECRGGQRENAFDRAETEAVVEALGGGVRLEDLERQHLCALRLNVLGRGAKQLGSDALAPRSRAHVQQVEEPGALALPVERGDPDVVSEQDDIVVGVRVVVSPELVRNLALELGGQLAHELLVVGGRGADHRF